MALIICPECGQEISDKSAHCIYCGYPLNEKNDTQNDDESIKTLLYQFNRILNDDAYSPKGKHKTKISKRKKQ